MREDVDILPVVEAAPGPLRLAPKVHYPLGYKPNSEAPVVLRLGAEEGYGERLSSAAGETITWVDGGSGDRSIEADLTLYYCQVEDARWCLIHNRRLRIPVRQVTGGQKEVTIPYGIEAPARG